MGHGVHEVTDALAMSFDKVLPLVLRFEGGYQARRDDPGNVAPHGIGGGTNRGITQRTYDAYKDSLDLPYKPVRYITDAEVREIYRRDYWAIPSGPSIVLNAGKPLLAAVHFDWGVHGGTKKARVFLQAAVRTFPDGAWGPNTLDAIAKCQDRQAAGELLRLRVAHHWVRCTDSPRARDVLLAAKIPNMRGVWPTYSASARGWLKGWLARVRSLAHILELPIHASFEQGAEAHDYQNP